MDGGGKSHAMADGGEIFVTDCHTRALLLSRRLCEMHESTEARDRLGVEHASAEIVDAVRSKAGVLGADDGNILRIVADDVLEIAVVRFMCRKRTSEVDLRAHDVILAVCELDNVVLALVHQREEVREESEGNHYMEKVRDEMIKMSRDESERYLYLREQMAIRDKASQLRSAEKRGRREGELLKLILQIQKKIQKNKELHQIADEVEEEVIKIQPIYEAIKEHPEADKEEIYKMLK